MGERVPVTLGVARPDRHLPSRGWPLVRTRLGPTHQVMQAGFQHVDGARPLCGERSSPVTGPGTPRAPPTGVSTEGRGAPRMHPGCAAVPVRCVDFGRPAMPERLMTMYAAPPDGRRREQSRAPRGCRRRLRKSRDQPGMAGRVAVASNGGEASGAGEPRGRERAHVRAWPRDCVMPLGPPRTGGR